MKIKVRSLFLLVFAVLMAMNVGLLTFGEFAADWFTVITASVSIALAACCVFSKKIYRTLYPLVGHLQKWIIILPTFLAFDILISSAIYGTPIIFGIKRTYYMAIILLIYPLAYIISTDGGIDRLSKVIMFFGIVGLVLKTVVWYLFNYLNIDIMHYLLYEFGDVWTRNGNQRIPGSKVTGIIFGLAMYRLFRSKSVKDKSISAAVILFLCWYAYAVYQSRNQLISFVIAIAIVILVEHNSFWIKGLTILLAVISSVVILNSNTFHEFVESFSDGSAAYRFKEIPYYFSLFKGNYLLGIAYRSVNDQFWNGVNGRFFLSDIGTLAQMVLYGFIGFPIVVYPFFRIPYIAIKLWKKKSPYDVFAISAGVYTILSSAMSNDIFHATRYFGLPILLIYYEYVYYVTIKKREVSVDLANATITRLPDREPLI